VLNPRLVVRSLLKTPLITIIAIVSLGLGIGANAAIFSIFEQAILRALPVEEPGQLVNLSSPGPKSGSVSAGNAGGSESVFSYPMFRDLERLQGPLEGLAAHNAFGANRGYQGTTLSGEGVLVSGNYFEVLGLHPALGRLLTADDDREAGAHPVAVISHAYWRSRFSSDPAVVGETLVINGQPMTILGVAPRGFKGTTFGNLPQVFVPISMKALMNPGWEGFDSRRTYWIYLFGRLPAEQSLASASTALTSQYQAILNQVEVPLQTFSEETLARFKAKPIDLVRGDKGQSSVTAEMRTPLLLLLGVTAFVLLIAAANVANLLLTKASNRASEFAVRLSLGAPRRFLLSQLLAESFLLALGGAFFGLLVAQGTLRMLFSILPSDADLGISMELSPMTWLFMAVLAGIAGLAGLYPAIYATKHDLASSLKNLRLASSPAASRFRTAMVTLQIALSMTLLVSAGLFTKSLLNVGKVDLGMEIEQLATFAVAPELNGYSKVDSRAFFARVEREVGALPGVRGIATSMVPLIDGSSWGSGVSVEGFLGGPDVDANARFNEVGSGFLETVGIRLLAGRDFAPRDDLGAPRVAIVNEGFARKFGLGTDVVGRRMGTSTGNAAELDIEIIGLVEDTNYHSVKDAIPPQYFLANRQSEEHGAMNFYVRATSDPETLLATLRRVVGQVDTNLPVENLRTMAVQVRENLILDRVLSTLSGSFALLATVLAAIGLYGVLAYAISQRTREIGLRMALGADGSRIYRMVLRQVGWLVVPGALLGILAALGVGRAGRSLLYELESHDPRVLLSAALLMFFVAFVAGLIPALRAARISPMEALRDD